MTSSPAEFVLPERVDSEQLRAIHDRTLFLNSFAFEPDVEELRQKVALLQSQRVGTIALNLPLMILADDSDLRNYRGMNLQHWITLVLRKDGPEDFKIFLVDSYNSTKSSNNLKILEYFISILRSFGVKI